METLRTTQEFGGALLFCVRLKSPGRFWCCRLSPFCAVYDVLTFPHCNMQTNIDCEYRRLHEPICRSYLPKSMFIQMVLWVVLDENTTARLYQSRHAYEIPINVPIFVVELFGSSDRSTFSLAYDWLSDLKSSPLYRYIAYTRSR